MTWLYDLPNCKRLQLSSSSGIGSSRANEVRNAKKTTKMSK